MDGMKAMGKYEFNALNNWKRTLRETLKTQLLCQDCRDSLETTIRDIDDRVKDAQKAGILI